jgi:hypothetical protein
MQIKERIIALFNIYCFEAHLGTLLVRLSLFVLIPYINTLEVSDIRADSFSLIYPYLRRLMDLCAAFYVLPVRKCRLSD